MRSRVWIYWVPAVLWAGVIWYASSLSIGISSPFQVTGVDKLGHLGEYGVLGVAVAWALTRTRPDLPGWEIVQGAMLAGGFWGWVDEAHQFWVPGRTTDPLDLLADLAGAAAGGWLVTRMIRSQKNTPAAPADPGDPVEERSNETKHEKGSR